jgi:hypothetical protein
MGPTGDDGNPNTPFTDTVNSSTTFVGPGEFVYGTMTVPNDFISGQTINVSWLYGGGVGGYNSYGGVFRWDIFRASDNLLLGIETLTINSGNLPAPGFTISPTPATPFSTSVLEPGDVLNLVMLIPYTGWSIRPTITVNFDYVSSIAGPPGDTGPTGPTGGAGTEVGPTGPPITVTVVDFPSTGSVGEYLYPTTTTKYFLDSFDSNDPQSYLVTALIFVTLQTPSVPESGDFIAYGLTDEVSYEIKKNLNAYPILLSDNNVYMYDNIDVLIPKNSSNANRFFVEARVSGSNAIFINKFDYTARAIG